NNVVFVKRSFQSAAPQIAPELLKILPAHIKVFFAHLEFAGLTALSKSTPPATNDEVFAFCGIANPNGFIDSLKELGFRLTGQRIFPDHHRFIQSDIDNIHALARGRPLICTEKDSVKLRELN